MRELRLVDVTSQGSHLILEDADKKQYRVPLDERLTAAVRRDPARPGQLETALESQLTPRDIQARIRAGQGAQEVALAAGVPVERIHRYAGPVLAEREHMAAQAQAAPSRRQSGGTAPSLGDLVESRLADLGVAADSVRWDAWRADEHRWTVRLCYLTGGREVAADWDFDPRGRVLQAADDEARWLVEGSSRPAGPSTETDAPAAPVRRLSSVPGVGAATSPQAPAQAPAQSADEVYDHEADQPDDASTPARDDAPEQPSRQVARAGRRPAVPSWDDIMFGARKHD